MSTNAGPNLDKYKSKTAVEMQKLVLDFLKRLETLNAKAQNLTQADMEQLHNEFEEYQMGIRMQLKGGSGKLKTPRGENFVLKAWAREYDDRTRFAQFKNTNDVLLSDLARVIRNTADSAWADDRSWQPGSYGKTAILGETWGQYLDQEHQASKAKSKAEEAQSVRFVVRDEPKQEQAPVHKAQTKVAPPPPAAKQKSPPPPPANPKLELIQPVDLPLLKKIDAFCQKLETLIQEKHRSLSVNKLQTLKAEFDNLNKMIKDKVPERPYFSTEIWSDWEVGIDPGEPNPLLNELREVLNDNTMMSLFHKPKHEAMQEKDWQALIRAQTPETLRTIVFEQVSEQQQHALNTLNLKTQANSISPTVMAKTPPPAPPLITKKVPLHEPTSAKENTAKLLPKITELNLTILLDDKRKNELVPDPVTQEMIAEYREQCYNFRGPMQALKLYRYGELLCEQLTLQKSQLGNISADSAPQRLTTTGDKKTQKDLQQILEVIAKLEPYAPSSPPPSPKKKLGG